MPVMDGYEASRQIRAFEQAELRPAAPIIAMTGNAFERDRQTCLKAGMNDFISKPVDPKALAQIIEDCKSGRQDTQKSMEKTRDVLDSDFFVDEPEAVNACTEVNIESHQQADPVFNRAGFLERFGNDEALSADVLESFFQEFEELVASLLAAITQDNPEPETVRGCAHALKGRGSQCQC